jgi:hypothetical protein
MTYRRWVSLADYLGPYAAHSDATPERIANARLLLTTINKLLDAMAADKVPMQTNPFTKNYIAGGGNGGARSQACPVGAPASKHKSFNAIDLFDPEGHLKEYMTAARLEFYDLYMESPRHTPTWLHLQRIPPLSRKRVFLP